MNGSYPVFYCPSRAFTAVISGHGPSDPFTFTIRNLSLFSATFEDVFCPSDTCLCPRAPLFWHHHQTHPSCRLPSLAFHHCRSCCHHLRRLYRGPRVQQGRRLPRRTQNGAVLLYDCRRPSCCHSLPCSLHEDPAYPCVLGFLCCCYSLLPLLPLLHPPPLQHSSHLSRRRSSTPSSSIAGEILEVSSAISSPAPGVLPELSLCCGFCLSSRSLCGVSARSVPPDYYWRLHQIGPACSYSTT